MGKEGREGIEGLFLVMKFPQMVMNAATNSGDWLGSRGPKKAGTSTACWAGGREYWYLYAVGKASASQ